MTLQDLNFNNINNTIQTMPEGVLEQAPDTKATDIRLEPNKELLYQERTKDISRHLEIIKNGQKKGYSLAEIESAFPEAFNDNNPIEAVVYRAGLAKDYSPEEIDKAFGLDPSKTEAGFGSGLGQASMSILRGVGELAGTEDEIQKQRQEYIQKQNRKKLISEARGGSFEPMLPEFDKDAQQMHMVGEVAPDVAIGFGTGFTGNVAKGIAMDMAASSALEGTRYLGTKDFDPDAATKAMIGIFGAGIGNAAVPLLGKMFSKSGIPEELDSESLQILMKDLGVTNEQAVEVFDAYKKITGKESLTKDEELAILAKSQGGAGVSAIKEAGKLDPSVITSARRGAEERGAKVREATEIKPEEIKTTIEDMQKDIKAYRDNVKKEYSVVRDYANKIAGNTTVRFADDKMTDILGDMDSIIGQDAYKTTAGLNSFLKSYGNKDLTMGNMLDMYKDMNKFIRDNKGMKSEGLEKVIEAKNQVKTRINKVMRTKPKGEAWIQAFETANNRYKNKAQFEETDIYKTVTKAMNSKSTENQIGVVKNVLKYSPDEVDGLMIRMNPATREKFEKMIVHHISEPTIRGSKAIDFVGLSNKMDEFTFSSKAAKQTKEIVDQFAKVFKNDPELAKLETKYGSDPWSQTMEFATTIKGKMKMFFISRVWSNLKKNISKMSDVEREKLARGKISTILSETIKDLDNVTSSQIKNIVDEAGIIGDQRKTLTRSISRVVKSIRRNRVKVKPVNEVEIKTDEVPVGFPNLGIKSNGKKPKSTGGNGSGKLEDRLTSKQPKFDIRTKPSKPVNNAGMLGLKYGDRATAKGGLSGQSSKEKLKDFLDGIANPKVNVSKEKVRDLYNMLKADGTTMYAATQAKEDAWNKAMDIVSHVMSKDSVSPKVKQQMIDAVKHYHSLLGDTI